MAIVDLKGSRRCWRQNADTYAKSIASLKAQDIPVIALAIAFRTRRKDMWPTRELRRLPDEVIFELPVGDANLVSHLGEVLFELAGKEYTA